MKTSKLRGRYCQRPFSPMVMRTHIDLNKKQAAAWILRANFIWRGQTSDSAITTMNISVRASMVPIAIHLRSCEEAI